MDDYPMGDLTDFSASASKPETLTYSQFEADLNAKLLAAQTQKLQETIKWLKRRMPTHDQGQIMLDQMTYECIAVIPTGDKWRNRLLQGQNVVTPDEMRAAMRESGLLPGNRGELGTGGRTYSEDSAFSLGSSRQEESNVTEWSHSSHEEPQNSDVWSRESSGHGSLSSGTNAGFSKKRKR